MGPMRRTIVTNISKWVAGLVVLFGTAGLSSQSSTPWVIGPFTRPAQGNPVVAPNASSAFQDPIEKKPVQWEVLHTFNPAAVVRHGKVYVLYRAEDNSGALEIGGHTSRLGMA
jgi:beta-1,2-mannosidase